MASATIALLNLCMLGGTWLFTIYYRSLSVDWETLPLVKYFLFQLNLTTENVLAVWYSSMLLLLVSVMAVLCFIADGKRHQSSRDRFLRKGWILFAIVFAGLSLDELGSLHERLLVLAALSPVADYVPAWIELLALPVGLVSLYMLTFGCLHVRRYPWAFTAMILGAILLLSIPIQEKIEMTLWDAALERATWQRPIPHMLLEEGAELFGMLSFFSAMAIYLTSAATESSSAGTDKPPTIQFRVNLRTALVSAVGLICLLGMGMIGVGFALRYLPGGDTGIPHNWFPSALATLIAIICFQLWDTVGHDDRLTRLMYLACALFSLVVSIYYGASMQYWLSTLGFLGTVIHGSLCVTAMILGFTLALLVRNWWGRAGSVTWAVLFGLSLAMGRSYAGPLDFVALAVLLPSLMTHAQRWRPGPISV